MTGIYSQTLHEWANDLERMAERVEGYRKCAAALDEPRATTWLFTLHEELAMAARRLHSLSDRKLGKTR